MKNMYQQFIDLCKTIFMAFIVTMLLTTALFIITSNWEMSLGMGIAFGILTCGFELAKYKNRILALMSLTFLPIGFAILGYYRNGSDLSPLLSGMIAFIYSLVLLCIGFFLKKLYNKIRR